MDADVSTLSVGDFVAVNCENSREPAIGCCKEIFEEDIDIVWMEGEYTSAWKTRKIRDPKNRRKIIEWRDSIPKLSVLLFGFTLTTTNHLRKRTIERLKEQYDKVRGSQENSSNEAD